jgi:hypothetical protein
MKKQVFSSMALIIAYACYCWLSKDVVLVSNKEGVGVAKVMPSQSNWHGDSHLKRVGFQVDTPHLNERRSGLVTTSRQRSAYNDKTQVQREARAYEVSGPLYREEFVASLK